MMRNETVFNTSRLINLDMRLVFFGILLLIFTGMRVGLHNDTHTEGAKQGSQVKVVYAELIDFPNITFDFDPIETLLWRSSAIDAQGLRMSPDMQALLETIVNMLPSSLTPEELQRLEFLFMQSLTEEQGQTMFQLVQQYRSYILAYNQRRHTHSAELSPTERQKRIQDLQTHHFGTQMAEKLFSKKNRTVFYLDERLRLMQDTSLSEAERSERLDTLTESYEKSVSND